MQDQTETLLKDVDFKIETLRKANELFSARLAPNFNIFDYLRTDEMGLSRCIASLLNPTGTHGQGSVFLKSFLKYLDQELPKSLSTNWAATAMDGCKVSLEVKANDLRRIDVYLRFRNGEKIGIENKPWAGDQENQLKDYADFIKQEADKKNWLLIYLCNDESSTYSIKKDKREELEVDGNFVRLDYAKIIEWLELCASQSKALVVRVFIEELAKFVRMKVNGELDMSEEEEIKEIILKSDENIRSAFNISKVFPSLKKDLLTSFKKDLEKKLYDHDPKFIFFLDDSMFDDKPKATSGFWIKFSKEQNLYLRFEFEWTDLNGLHWGIRREGYNVTTDDDLWGKINKVMMNKFDCASQYGGPEQPKWWPWWISIDTAPDEFKELDVGNWGSSEKPWVHMKSTDKNNLADKITELAIKVHDAFGENLTLLSQGVIKQADA